MTKQEVIEELCKISTEVAEALSKARGTSIAHDCFCGENELSKDGGFSFDPTIFEFIRNSVKMTIQRGA